MIRPLIFACLVALAAVGVPACGGSQSSRAATISSLDTSYRTAVGALLTYDHEHALDLIAHAPSLEAGKASLVAFRARVDLVWKALDAAHVALDAANTVNDDTSIKGAQTALDNAIAALAALTGGKP